MSPNQEFPWQALGVVCDGISVLDISRLHVKSESEAYQFLLSYGFDLYEASHFEQIQKIYLKAVAFIQNYLCPPGRFPSHLESLESPQSLISYLLIVSESKDERASNLVNLRPWICAILRVMHVVLHLQSDLRLKYLPKIKRQTIDRLSAHIQTTNDGIFLGFEGDKVPLMQFEKKESKVKDSILIKLLHKASVTAQEIYDHIGVRFVTRHRLDSMRVVKYLIDHHLVAFPNVLSVRCRNSLLKSADFHKYFDSFQGVMADLEQAERHWPYPEEAENPNQFSAKSYHSLQFTARQLIRIPVVRKGGQRREMTFFFPVEIQIFDQKSYLQAISGEADHAIYKRKQLEAVRRRVLGSLVETFS